MPGEAMAGGQSRSFPKFPVLPNLSAGSPAQATAAPVPALAGPLAGGP